VRFPPALVTDPTITPARRTVIGAAEALGPLTTKLVAAVEAEDVPGMIAAGIGVVVQAEKLITSFAELAAALKAAAQKFPGMAAQITEFVKDLPRRLLDLLLLTLLDLQPVVGAVLTALGVIERVYHPGDPLNPAKPGYDSVTVHLDRLVAAVTDPVGQLSELSGWGGDPGAGLRVQAGPGFDAMALFTALEAALALLGYPVLLRPAENGKPPVLEAFDLDLKPTADGTGLDVAFSGPVSVLQQITFPVSPTTWKAEVGVRAEIGVGATGTVRPPFDIAFSQVATSFEAAVTVDLHAEPAEPIVLLGQAGGSRLEIGGVGVGGGLVFTVDGNGTATATPTARGEVTGGKLVIDVASGDGFLATLLGGGRIESGFDVGFAFAPGTGLAFHGSGALEVSLPVHIELGPVEVEQIFLVARIEGRRVPLELSAGLSASLGPIRAAVDRLGVVADFGFPEGGGNLGPADLKFAFKPPSGVGLSLDLAVLTGGGYLYADPERGEYAGALELELGGFLSIKALGLITTRMPDGSKGFSLLLILTAEFAGGGLQLGYGFRLIAVGGLVGLNRTMRLDALAEGLRSGAIESVMFPQDIVANAPRIISDLRKFFPPEEGKFLIGPMVKIGWGTPTLISISVGVIVEIPGAIAIVGILKVALPTEIAPLLVLQVNFMGAIEPDKQRLWFYATLFESRVLYMPLDGGMGLLVAWGADANLVVTVGGFHPAFTPPPLPFPSPNRVSIDILNSPACRIRVVGYFAVTSNTAQFGARAELYYGFSAASLEGHIGFDALFRFSPFSFIVQISAHVALKVFGIGLFSISLQFALEGPAPWRARGRGSISLLLFEVSADFDTTWGDAGPPALPAVDILPILAAECADAASWQTVSPVGGSPLVSLRTLGETEDDLVLHPLGALFVRQRAVPLDLRLDKVGSQKPKDASQFTLTVVTPGLARRADADEMFALGQYQDMDDAAKLSRRPFEPAHGGLELGVDGNVLSSARAVRRSARYEEIVIDTLQRRRPGSKFAAYPAGLFRHLMAGNSISRSPLSRRQAELRQPFAETIVVGGEQYVVADTRTNIAVAPPFGSEAAALDHLAALVAEDPRRGGSLHVVPGVEQKEPVP
jgi:hypothetical protein